MAIDVTWERLLISGYTKSLLLTKNGADKIKLGLGKTVAGGYPYGGAIDFVNRSVRRFTDTSETGGDDFLVLAGSGH